MNKNNIKAILIILFVILSFIKFFTAKVGLLADPTLQLVVKPNPTISNTFHIKGEDNISTREKYEGTWYYEGKYKVIAADESGFAGEPIYDVLIIAWWILLGGLPTYMVIDAIKSKRALKVGRV